MVKTSLYRKKRHRFLVYKAVFSQSTQFAVLPLFCSRLIGVLSHVLSCSITFLEVSVSVQRRLNMHISVSSRNYSNLQWRTILAKLTIGCSSTNFPAFEGNRSFLARSQQSTIRLQSDTDKCCPHSHTHVSRSTLIASFLQFFLLS